MAIDKRTLRKGKKVLFQHGLEIREGEIVRLTKSKKHAEIQYITIATHYTSYPWHDKSESKHVWVAVSNICEVL